MGTKDSHLVAFLEDLQSTPGRCLRFFSEYLGGIDDVARVTSNDLRCFIVALKTRTIWENPPRSNGKRLSPVTINTYVKAIKAFRSRLKKRGHAISGCPASSYLFRARFGFQGLELLLFINE